MPNHILCGDIAGGTKDNLAAVKISKGDIEIVFKEARSTQRHQDFSQVLNDFLEDLNEEENLQVDSACFAVTGHC